MWTQIPYSARIGLPIRRYLGEAARKPILPPWKNTNGKNSTENYGIPNFCRFRKSLATSMRYYWTAQQSTASYFSIIVRYTDNDSYLSPVAPSNGTIPPSNGTVPSNNGTVETRNGTIDKKPGAIFFLILAIAKPLFGMTNHPLHPFLAPKSTVLHY